MGKMGKICFVIAIIFYVLFLVFFISDRGIGYLEPYLLLILNGSVFLFGGMLISKK